MNKKQKIILAIFIPIIILVVALTVAYYTGVTTHTTSEKVTSLFGRKLSSPHFFTTTTYNYNPFDWEKTWYVWLIFLIFICIFEYKMFEDKEIISNKKKKNKN